MLLKILVGLYGPTSGIVWYDDVNFTSLDKKKVRDIRMSVGMLFQGTALFDSMTVEENIRFPMDMFTNKTHKEKLDRVNYCLERVNLTGVNQKYPSQLSGGMQKRGHPSNRMVKSIIVIRTTMHVRKPLIHTLGIVILVSWLLGGCLNSNHTPVDKNLPFTFAVQSFV